jgi:hypothetical protein
LILCRYALPKIRETQTNSVLDIGQCRSILLIFFSRPLTVPVSSSPRRNTVKGAFAFQSDRPVHFIVSLSTPQYQSHCQRLIPLASSRKAGQALESQQRNALIASTSRLFSFRWFFILLASSCHVKLRTEIAAAICWPSQNLSQHWSCSLRLILPGMIRPKQFISVAGYLLWAQSV